jgi:hypothetical protein
VLPTLKGHFFANLTDAISSVRQGAAQALAKTAKAYTADHELVTELKDAMLKAFGRVQEQPVESHKYGDLSSEPPISVLQNAFVTKTYGCNPKDMFLIMLSPTKRMLLPRNTLRMSSLMNMSHIVEPHFEIGSHLSDLMICC